MVAVFDGSKRYAYARGAFGLVLALMCAIMAATSARSAEAPPAHVRIATGEHPPLISEHLPHYGIGSQIVTEALAHAGITTEYDFMPWPRIMELGSAGKYDIHSFWVFNEERAERNLFSDVFLVEDVVFFHSRDEELEWTTLEDLAGLRLGLVNGWIYTPELVALVEEGVIEAEFVNDETLSFRKLANGRVDAAPTSLAIGKGLMEEILTPAQRAGISFNPSPLISYDERLLVSKSLPYAEALIEKINAGIAHMRENGRIDEILAPVRLR